MEAYHGKQSKKTAIIKQLKAHAAADELIHGVGWKNGKGCAVGCTLHNYDHALYEPRFGIPRSLAYLEDAIFEGLSPEAAQAWPVRFMGSIAPGADLSLVQWRFLHWLLTDNSVNPGITHPLVKDAVSQCAALMKKLADGEKIEDSAWSAAQSAAESVQSAAWSAWSAARLAARLAVWSKMADKLIELLATAGASAPSGEPPSF